jgi:16S rRNA (cytidine1402-2'-O)-methyltransferase
MSDAKLSPGLYIVATPIGNLSDLSPRAADILRRADLIAVEDTRVTAKLLRHAGSDRPMTPYHDHNAERVRPGLIAKMLVESVALVSDAGTPLISDPGYKLVREARAAGINVTTIPGPSAPIAALTLAGLPTDRFAFFGFLPAKAGARATLLAEAAAFGGTLLFFESGPRTAATLAAMADALGDREAAVVREISKAFEEAVAGRLSELAATYREKAPRGEIVIVIAPPGAPDPADLEDLDEALIEALTRLSPSQAAGEVAKRFGADRRQLYARALNIQGEADSAEF